MRSCLHINLQASAKLQIVLGKFPHVFLLCVHQRAKLGGCRKSVLTTAANAANAAVRLE